MSFRKTEYEEMYRYYEFNRDDALDGFESGETITDTTITCTDNADGSDTTLTMISDDSVVDDTRVVYLLSGGEAGHTYTITIQVETSRGQKFEGKTSIYVTA